MPNLAQWDSTKFISVPDLARRSRCGTLGHTGYRHDEKHVFDVAKLKDDNVDTNNVNELMIYQGIY